MLIQILSTQDWMTPRRNRPWRTPRKSFTRRQPLHRKGVTQNQHLHSHLRDVIDRMSRAVCWGVVELQLPDCKIRRQNRKNKTSSREGTKHIDSSIRFTDPKAKAYNAANVFIIGGVSVPTTKARSIVCPTIPRPIFHTRQCSSPQTTCFTCF